MLFLKMCKLKASSPCTWNTDDPNLLQLTAQKTDTSLFQIIMKIQRNFQCFIFLSNHFRMQVLISALALLGPLELGKDIAFLKFHKMTENWPGETICATKQLKRKQCDLHFLCKNLKFMPCSTNVTKCLQKCKILWLLSMYFMVNKCASTNYLGSPLTILMKSSCITEK